MWLSVTSGRRGLGDQMFAYGMQGNRFKYIVRHKDTKDTKFRAIASKWYLVEQRNEQPENSSQRHRSITRQVMQIPTSSRRDEPWLDTTVKF